MCVCVYVGKSTYYTVPRSFILLFPPSLPLDMYVSSYSFRVYPITAGHFGTIRVTGGWFKSKHFTAARLGFFAKDASHLLSSPFSSTLASVPARFFWHTKQLLWIAHRPPSSSQNVTFHLQQAAPPRFTFPKNAHRYLSLLSGFQNSGFIKWWLLFVGKASKKELVTSGLIRLACMN